MSVKHTPPETGPEQLLRENWGITRTKHTPATPLPWKQDPTGDCGPGWIGILDADYFVATDVEIFEDADYLVHAANAYPKLVETLRNILAHEWDAGGDTATGKSIRAMLRELGEID